MPESFTTVTELSGEEISVEQLDRMFHRYSWAKGYVSGKDVVEVGCGSGQGLALLAKEAKSLVGSDYDDEILAIARDHYGDRFAIMKIDAADLPFSDNSKDVIVIFEALYYIPNYIKFFSEAKRVLRDDGVLLIANANKALPDFNPSPYSFKYHGVIELAEELDKIGFTTEFFGYLSTRGVSLKQKLLTPVKRLVVALGLMPKTMQGKQLLKRFVFGKLVRMPAELFGDESIYCAPVPLEVDKQDTEHKVIYCAAKKSRR